MPRVRLTFLGSGDAFCDWRVNDQNNALVETDQGLVLIDCGMTAVQSMRELGLSVHDVHTVLITHVHADHACPSNLLLERFYGGPVGPRWASTRLLAPPDVLDPLRRSLRPFFDEVIGPEGGLADEELAEAARAGWQTASLGPFVLRTETVAAAVLGALLILEHQSG